MIEVCWRNGSMVYLLAYLIYFYCIKGLIVQWFDALGQKEIWSAYLIYCYCIEGLTVQCFYAIGQKEMWPWTLSTGMGML